MLLEGDGVAAKIDRLILAEDFFGHAEASADQALWRVLSSIGPALPAPEHRTIVGEEIDEWRDAFRLIQGFEIQSTLLPFIQSHNVDLGPGIKERFEAGGANHLCRGRGRARKFARRSCKHLAALVPAGNADRAADDADPAARAGDSRRRLLRRVPHADLGYTCLAGHAGLPQISIPATEAAGCPIGLSFIGWKGGDEALLDLAVRLEPLLRNTRLSSSR